MTRLATILQRSSLTFSFVALLIGVVSLARVFNFAGRARLQGPEFVQHSLILCVVSFLICLAVLANLVVDVTRGYSPNRCSVASVIVLAALAGPASLAICLVGYFSR